LIDCTAALERADLQGGIGGENIFSNKENVLRRLERLYPQGKPGQVA
jgi:hypothetical protein